MKEVIEESFKFALAILRLSGLYSDGSKTWFQVIRSYIVFVFSLYNSFSLILTFLYDHELDDLQRNQTFLALIVMSSSAFKIVPFLVFGDKIKNCIDYFKDDGFQPRNDEGRRILDDCVRICRRNEDLYWGGLASAQVFWWSFTFLMHKYTLPLSLWLPYDYRNNHLIFWITYVGVSVDVLYTTFLSEAMEPLLGGLVYHATCQLRILKYNLQNLDKVAKEGGSMAEAIKECIIHHSNILGFFDEFEKYFSFCILSQIAGSTLGLCYCCIGLLNNPPGSATGALFAIDYLFVSFQIFFYGFFGTLLFEENEGLINSVYMGNWYDYDAECKNLLIIVMERSKRPLILTAAKVVNLTLATFTSVLKTGYSLVAVMNNSPVST